MAITFLEKRKIQRRYIIIFGIVLLVTISVIWRGFFVEEKPIFLGEVTKPSKKVELDFKILENPILKELQPFEEIEPFKEVIVEEEIIEKVGRENPFTPY
jgi:hypothetical protein